MEEAPRRQWNDRGQLRVGLYKQVCVSGGEPGPSASTANTAPRKGGVFTPGTDAQAEGTTHAPWAPADS